MNTFSTALLAGGIGAVATNLLHEVVRRLTPDAPRVDLLGMQALSRLLHVAGLPTPDHSALYTMTLLGDLASNSAYFALVGTGPRERAITVGSALGLAAGVGAVYLPPYLGLSTRPTERTATTAALTVALYSSGGLVASLTYRALSA